MNLEILSFGDALKYGPKERSYGIRIIDEFRHVIVDDLKESENWVGIKKYYFGDLWPRNWKEYSWVKDEDWNKLLAVEGKNYPLMTKESLIGYIESKGHPCGRETLFDENIAKKILRDFEGVQGDVETVVVHCWRGKNRSPAIGIAMNEIYGWGIPGLKEKFPGHRRFVYDKMMEVGGKIY